MSYPSSVPVFVCMCFCILVFSVCVCVWCDLCAEIKSCTVSSNMNDRTWSTENHPESRRSSTARFEYINNDLNVHIGSCRNRWRWLCCVLRWTRSFEQNYRLMQRNEIKWYRCNTMAFVCVCCHCRLSSAFTRTTEKNLNYECSICTILA